MRLYILGLAMVIIGMAFYIRDGGDIDVGFLTTIGLILIIASSVFSLPPDNTK